MLRRRVWCCGPNLGFRCLIWRGWGFLRRRGCSLELRSRAENLGRSFWAVELGIGGEMSLGTLNSWLRVMDLM